jgi:nucleotide-binding universal stress UspA family protein
MMFTRILVPLDGSDRAEQAIPVAARIARAAGGSVILIQAVPLPLDFQVEHTIPSERFSENVTEEGKARAFNYLDAASRMAELVGLKTEMRVEYGDPAPSLLAAIESLDVDLVVMCSHGYTGFKRWMLGSVADKIARHAPVPILILREGAPLPAIAARKPVRALVALDGSPLSEAVFEPVAYLVAGLAHATSHQGELRLLRVVDLPFGSGTLKSQTYVDSKTRDEAVKAAQDYLGTLSARLGAGGLANLNIAVTTAVVSDPDVAEAIIKQADSVESGPVDVVALATHGRGGMQHFVMGSVTERVLHHSTLPLLIVRPPKEQQGSKKEERGSVVEAQSWVGLL